jgi:predicted AlkP superfamily pyrophosphatase or phosphodiesterase
VPFDSVFARCAGAWGFGSPDVVPIWDGHGRYTWRAYSAEMEDWSTNTNLFELDTWVFNRTDELLDGARLQPHARSATGCLICTGCAARRVHTAVACPPQARCAMRAPSLRITLIRGWKMSDREAARAAAPPTLAAGPAVVFLHLLGLDSQSHAHGGPAARPYLDNVGLVDRGVAALVAKVERLYPDRATAYVVTSDHGCARGRHCQAAGLALRASGTVAWQKAGESSKAALAHTSAQGRSIWVMRG